MSEPPVRLEIDGEIARLELNRPEAANAINLDVANVLAGAVDALGERDDVRAVLLTGAGDRFCAGW